VRVIARGSAELTREFHGALMIGALIAIVDRQAQQRSQGTLDRTDTQLS
jgi:hypothetical protein